MQFSVEKRMARTSIRVQSGKAVTCLDWQGNPHPDRPAPTNPSPMAGSQAAADRNLDPCALTPDQEHLINPPVLLGARYT